MPWLKRSQRHCQSPQCHQYRWHLWSFQLSLIPLPNFLLIRQAMRNLRNLLRSDHMVHQSKLHPRHHHPQFPKEYLRFDWITQLFGWDHYSQLIGNPRLHWWYNSIHTIPIPRTRHWLDYQNNHVLHSNLPIPWITQANHHLDIGTVQVELIWMINLNLIQTFLLE